MTKRTHYTALLVAAGALLAVPAVGQAHHKAGHTQGGQGKSCAKKPTVNKGFVVKGTLVSYDAGTAAAGDETVTLTVTKMNKHARRSGLTDANPATPGTQYTIAGTTDPFTVQASGYNPTATPPDVPSAGDKVRVIGKVAVTRKKCLATPTTNPYGTVNVRKVKIVDATP